MTFLMAFRAGPLAVENTVLGDWPRATDDQQTAVVQACALLAEVDGSHFCFYGFGRRSWPVDVAYDLSAVLEQLTDLLRNMCANLPGCLDLYSQGIECGLTFAPQEDCVRILCHSRTKWSPNPSVEIIDRVILLRMFLDLRKQVAYGLESVDAQLILLSPFAAWAEGRIE